MIKKAVLMVFATMLIVFGASIAYANQIDGMVSGEIGTLSLPTGLTASVNPGGTGDALIYGYYNARESFNYIRVVNTSETTAVKARIRFREAKRSKEILDFNICLSNKDQWSAWVWSPTADGPAIVMPWDTDTNTAPSLPAKGQPFFYKDTATIAGLADVTAADTQEGYFEIIATNSKGGGTHDNHIVWSDDECTNPMSGNVANTSNPVQVYTDAPDVLAGNLFILNANGAYSYNAAAISQCNLGFDYAISNESPTFAQCDDGLPGIDYILTKQSHVAMYNLQGVPFFGATEVVVTFPTKWLHWTGAAADTTGRYLYNKPFDTVDAARCEPITLNKYDREEDTVTTSTGFSPSGSQGPALCNEVNVIKIGDSAITNSNVAAQVDVDDIKTPTDDGWLRIGLDTGTITCAAGNSVCVTDRESLGLPSLGFVLQTHQDWMSGMDSTIYNAVIRANTAL